MFSRTRLNCGDERCGGLGKYSNPQNSGTSVCGFTNASWGGEDTQLQIRPGPFTTSIPESCRFWQKAFKICCHHSSIFLLKTTNEGGRQRQTAAIFNLSELSDKQKSLQQWLCKEFAHWINCWCMAKKREDGKRVIARFTSTKNELHNKLTKLKSWHVCHLSWDLCVSSPPKILTNTP